MLINKRTFLTGVTSMLVMNVMPAWSKESSAIHIVKGLGCGCCTAWEEILIKEGFEVTSESLHPADLVKLNLKNGVPQELFSCHTAMVNEYVVVGHVPADDIRKLIADKPNGLGIAVANMPYGSPGMGPEDEREAYDVMLFKVDGSTELFTRYNAA